MAQPMLTLRQLNRATLARQGLLEPLARVPVARLVERIGSLQAQHPDWPPLALQSHLPADAPLVDLSRWRQAVGGAADDQFRFSDEAGRTLLDLPDAPRPDGDTPAPPRLLARWDSLLLAYGTAHRARVLPAAHQSTVITRNADVLPTFLVDGIVAGTWLPRKDRDDTPRLELRPFGRLSAANRDALEAEGQRLLPILGRGAFSRYPGTD